MNLSMFTGVLEVTINKLLLLSSESQQAFKPFAGQTIKMMLSSNVIYIKIQPKSVRILKAHPGPYHLILTTTLTAMSQFPFVASSNRKAYLQQHIDMEGDVVLAEVFQSVLLDSEIPWQDLLSEKLGPSMSHLMESAFTGIKEGIHLHQSALIGSLQDYFQEEIKISPTAEEVKDFCDDIDELRLQCDRVEAKLTYYKTTLL